jgi:hypothetical protein
VRASGIHDGLPLGKATHAVCPNRNRTRAVDSGAPLPFHPAMADGPTITEAKQREQEARAERLARALRANLGRRKEQLRARRTTEKPPSPARPPT